MTEVHFCNLCDQSVPQDQLDAGAAVRHGTRILCPSCREVVLMASGARRPQGRGALVVLLIIGLIGWAGAAWVWLEQQDLRSDVSILAGAGATRLEIALRETEARLGERLVRLDERADAQDAQFGALRQEQDQAAEAVQVQFGALERAVERLPDLADAVQRGEVRIREVEAARAVTAQDLVAVRAALETVRDGLAALEDRVAAAPPPSAAAGFSREVEELLAQLRDPDPLQRSIALEKLGKLSDARLVAYVEPLLKDSYEMNRYYAATALGGWKSAASTPALIDALLDEYSLVRKAANDALIAISGVDQGFDPKAPEGERRKAVERWKAWQESRAVAGSE